MTPAEAAFAALLLLPALLAAPREPHAMVQASRNMAMPAIILYTTSWCPHSSKAKEFLSRRGIAFRNRDIEKDREAAKELVTRYGTSSVPVIVIGNDEKVLHGFSAREFEKGLQEVLTARKNRGAEASPLQKGGTR